MSREKRKKRIAGYEEMAMQQQQKQSMVRGIQRKLNDDWLAYRQNCRMRAEQRVSFDGIAYGVSG